MWDAAVLSHCSFCYEILDQNGPVCWSIVVKEVPTVGSSFYGVSFFLTAWLRRRRMAVCISLFAVALTVNYTSEFRVLFEATKYFY